MQLTSSASDSAQGHGDIPVLLMSVHTGKKERTGRHTLVHLSPRRKTHRECSTVIQNGREKA